MKIELKDLLESGIAKRYRIDNFPTFSAVESLKELVTTILEPLSEAIEKSIIVSRGFMCERVNALSGCMDQVHVKGYAADVFPLDGNLQGFIEDAESWLRDNDVAFDESKEEIDKEGHHFWHIAIYGENGEQRRKFNEDETTTE